MDTTRPAAAHEVATGKHVQGLSKGSAKARQQLHATARQQLHGCATARDSSATAPRWKAHHGTWRPLVGDSSSDILKQHANPLRALSQGIIPAIVIRTQISPNASAEAVRRLPSFKSRSCRGSLWPTVGLWRTRNTGQLTLGTDLKTLLVANATSAELSQQSGQYREFYQQSGLTFALDALFDALRNLVGLREVRLGTMGATLSSGIFRYHGKRQKGGPTFASHFDTLRAHMWDERDCQHVTGVRACNVSYRDTISRFADLYRFDEQFSALLMLQPSDDDSQVTLFDTHWETLMKDCTLQSRSHMIGVNLGASFDNSHRCWSRNATLNLGPGDFYVFNSNRVHTVGEVKGSVPRLTLGAFVGYSPLEPLQLLDLKLGKRRTSAC